MRSRRAARDPAIGGRSGRKLFGRLLAPVLGAAAWPVFAGCSAAPDTGAGHGGPSSGGGTIPASEYRAAPEENTEVRVFYATDRKNDGTRQAPRFGGDRGAMSYGECIVSIPKVHRIGELESGMFDDPDRHVLLVSITLSPSRETFLGAIRAEVDRATWKDALVFVHGFNTSFEYAARRTAQMKFDLGFEGPGIFFSWPSADSTFRYAADGEQVAASVPNLKSLLASVIADSGAERVHLVAHSMGSRALTSALAELGAAGVAAGGASLHSIVLAAPDIDRDEFVTSIYPRIAGLGARITLYASSADLALQASKKFNGAARLGDVGSGIAVLQGMDTVDATMVDTSMLGHAYFAGSRSVVSDLFYLLRERQRAPPDRRFGIERVVRPAGTYWRMRK